MPDAPSQTRLLACPQCGTEVAPALLSCPTCHRLVHAAELRRLADEAEQATRANEHATALSTWRRALDLLPPDSRQHQTISATVIELSKKVDVPALATTEAKRKTGWAKGAAGLGAVGLLLWKFKFLVVFVLTKLKLLLLGLTKASTFFSMILSFGVYWAAWGWKFAAGLVVSIYIHEMGHVAMLRRYGIKATAPMFIPGVGALIRLKQYPASPCEDARVGLAGPIWGFGAAVAAYLVFLATDYPSWAAIARVGAWINLFNLLPVWQLDGGRAFRALTRSQRWYAVAAIAAMWFWTAEGLLVLLLIAAVVRAFMKSDAVEPDRTALIEYCFLVIVLSAMTMLHVPAPAQS